MKSTSICKWSRRCLIILALCLSITGFSMKAHAVSGSEIVNYAKSYVGKLPYVWGGTSLSSGADCSGFICAVYEQFGINLWGYRTKIRNSPLYTNIGTDLNQAKAGDILWFEGHVAIYTGDGTVVHASNAETGITISDASYREPTSIRRIADSE